jgi:hypothetical protein
MNTVPLQNRTKMPMGDSYDMIRFVIMFSFFHLSSKDPSLDSLFMLSKAHRCTVVYLIIELFDVFKQHQTKISL